MTYRALARRAWLVTRAHANPIRRCLAPRIAFALLCTIGAAIPVTFAYTAGQASHAQLALDAYEREEVLHRMLDDALHGTEKAVLLVWGVDVAQHAEMRQRGSEVPSVVDEP